MRRVEAPKSLLLVTEGFILDPQRPSFVELERLAAAARTSVYALRLDQRGIDGSLSSAPAPGSAGMDRMALRQGLDFLANATRGQVFNVVTTPDSALRSIERDLSGYYLLGVESDPADRADQGRDVSVTVNRPGVTVRPRRRLLIDDPAATAKDLAARALASPLVSSAVPIRVAAFAFGGQERGKVQLAVRAEIGEGYTSPVSMVVGYLLLGADGKVVDSRGVERELETAPDGVPSALQFAATISADPGEYVLRVTATDGSRAGSAERKVAARLHEVGSLRTSDLVAGGPVYTTAPLQPTVSSTVAFGNLHAYLRSLRRIGGQQRRSGSRWRERPTALRCWPRMHSFGLPAAIARCSRGSRRSGGFLPDDTFCVQSPRQGVPGERCGLAGVYAGHRLRDSGEPWRIEMRSSCPLPTSGSPRCLRPQANRPRAATSAAGWSRA